MIIAVRDAAIAGRIESFKTDYLDPNFVTGAELTEDYYSKSQADIAIAQAITEFKAFTADEIYASQATLTTDYYTITQSNEAISNALTNFLSTTISPTYVTNSALELSYYTKTEADTAISSAITAFESNTLAQDYVTNSTLTTNYYTNTEADLAISSAISTFQSGVLEAGYTTTAQLQNAYYTQTQVDSAISEAITIFNSDTIVENYTNSADLALNYYTKTNTDTAISNALTTFKSETLDDEYAAKATLTNDYYTKTAADQAVSSAVSTLKSEFVDNNGDITSAFADKVNQVVVTDTEAVAQEIADYSVSYGGNDYSIAQITQVAVNINGEFSAQWGIQTQVEDLQHGIGFMVLDGKTSLTVASDRFAVFNPSNGQWKSVFGVEGGQVFLNEAVIGTAFIGSLAVELSTVFEGEVLVNTRLDAAKLYGAKLEANEFWIENGGYSMAFDPDSSLAMWFGSTTYYNPDTDTDNRALGNAKFALTNTGEVRARSISIYNNSNQLMMNSNGLFGTYIRDLTVGTIKIMDEAITKSTPIETAVLTGSLIEGVILDTTISAGATGVVNSVISVIIHHTDPIGGTSSNITLTLELYDGTTTNTLLDSMSTTTTVDGSYTYQTLPVSVAANISQTSFRLRLVANNRQMWIQYQAKGYVIANKK